MLVKLTLLDEESVCELLKRKKGIWLDAETLLLLICSTSFY
jgi:hypothetical protein